MNSLELAGWLSLAGCACDGQREHELFYLTSERGSRPGTSLVGPGRPEGQKGRRGTLDARSLAQPAKVH